MTATSHDPNLAAAFRRQVAIDAAAPALVIDDDVWTRGELAAKANGAINRLLGLGLHAGDRVIAQYDTSADDVALAVAAAHLGLVLVPVPKRLGTLEINHLMQRSHASLFAFHGAAPPAGIRPPDGAHTASTASITAQDDTVTSAPVACTDVDRSEVALIGVTSGSTGQPKGVMHSWEAVDWAAERMRALSNAQPGESILVTGAGAGAPGFTFFTYLGLTRGLTIVRAGHWDPVAVLRLADKHRCVWTTMVPTMLYTLLEAREEALGVDGRLTHMRSATLGGSYISADLIQRARNDLGVEVLRMYAMAECMAHSSNLLSHDEADRDVMDGAPGPDSELVVLDHDLRPLPPGEIGEVAMRGPSLLKGYLADPAEMERLLSPEGYFCSGDLGKITDDGFVQIVGRKKDLIIRGGYNIDPAEVEELIRKHDAVAKVIVVGYPDEKYGERACAVVEVQPGREFDFDTMVAHLIGTGLSKEKLPERLELLDELPLSPDGKILRGKVQKFVADESPALA